jgi:hypothetical protein
MMTRLLAILAVLVLSIACNNTQAPMCTLEARAGINVTALDATTGSLLASAAGTARENTYSETLQSFQPGSLFGAFEREGVYEVTVSAPGYETWRADEVIVSAGECHVIPAQLTARLSRVP